MIFDASLCVVERRIRAAWSAAIGISQYAALFLLDVFCACGHGFGVFLRQ